MRLRASGDRLKIEHSIIDGLRPVLDRLLRDNPGIRSIVPGVIRKVRDARGEVKLGEETLKAGDAAAITDQEQIAVRSKEPSEVLLFDLA